MLMSRQVEATLETYCEFLKSIPDAAVLVKENAEIVWANQMAMDLFGGEGQSLWAQSVHQLVPPECREAHVAHVKGFWDDPKPRPMADRKLLEGLRKDGNRFHVAIMLNQVELLDGRYALAICRDMSREQHQRNLLNSALDRERKRAMIDPLTGAANLRHFEEELRCEIERSGRHSRIFSVAYLDLDNFKVVNDTQGHPEGNRVLKLIVEAASKRLRKTDLIARIGGDEFALLLPETDTPTVETPIGDVISEIMQRLQQGGWPVTLSCGVVTFRTPPDSTAEAMKAADELMYEAKRSGKNAIHEATFDNDHPTRGGNVDNNGGFD